MTAHIRPATTEDLDALVALWDAFTAEQNRYVRKVRRTKANRAAMRAHLTSLVGHGQVRVLADEAGVQGFAAVVVDLPQLDFHYASATVSDLYVAPALRGKGWGKRLLQAAIALIQDAGLHGVRITVASGNDAARTLYRQIGFRPMEETLLLPLDEDFVKFGPKARED